MAPITVVVDKREAGGGSVALENLALAADEMALAGAE